MARGDAAQSKQPMLTAMDRAAASCAAWIPGGSSNTTTSVICPRPVPMPGSEISAGLDCFCGLVQKKYDSSYDDALLPRGPQAHLEYQGICRRSVPQPSEGPYTSRMPTRSAKDIATGILLMLGADLLHRNAHPTRRHRGHTAAKVV